MANALYYDVLTAVKDRVVSLNLAGIPAEQVYLRKVITDRGCALPCILIAPFGTEQQDPDFENDAIGYPVAVVFVAASDADLTLNEPELNWREKVLHSFLDTPLPLGDVAQAPECYDCAVDPGPVVDWQRWLENLAVGALFLRLWAVRSRGRA